MAFLPNSPSRSDLVSDLKLAAREYVVTIQLCLGECQKATGDNDFSDDHFVHRVRVYSQGVSTILIVT